MAGTPVSVVVDVVFFVVVCGIAEVFWNPVVMFAVFVAGADDAHDRGCMFWIDRDERIVLGRCCVVGVMGGGDG